MHQYKTAPIIEVKTTGEAGSGQFEALVSVFGNVDLDGDRVLAGAFTRAVKEQEPPPVVWSHNWQIPPIGETLDWGETEKGLRVKGQLFVGSGDRHQYADMVYAAMKSREGRPPALKDFSYAYDVPEDGMEVKNEEAQVGNRKFKVVKELKTCFPIFEVGPTLRGANPATQPLESPKAADVARAIREGSISVNELRELMGLEPIKDVVQSDKYPAEMTALLLAAPNH